MARLFRVWMTGCVAVVAAALAGGRTGAAEERQATSRSSRYDVAETIERIEARAHEHGFNVFARLASSHRMPAAVRAADGAVIVFERARDGTPVLMESADSRPNLPLSLLVRRNELGGVEVVIHVIDWDGLPAEIASDMTHLPQMVEEALG